VQWRRICRSERLQDHRRVRAPSVTRFRTTDVPLQEPFDYLFAQAYPNCCNFADPADAQYMTRDDFFETFIGERARSALASPG